MFSCVSGNIFQSAYNYEGSLGAIYGETETTFKLWAPVSSDVELNLYSAGHTTITREDGDDTPEVYQMTYLEKGVWEVTIPGNFNSKMAEIPPMNKPSKMA